MSYTKLKRTQVVEAVDIQDMADMSAVAYDAYLREGLLFVDHHNVLRSAPAEYPLAVSKQQHEALMAYLAELGPKIGVE